MYAVTDFSNHAVTDFSNRHPGLDPGTTFFNTCERGRKVDAGSSPE
jgi:hypothetical protein